MVAKYPKFGEYSYKVVNRAEVAEMRATLVQLN
jgi:hypothetical protein